MCWLHSREFSRVGGHEQHKSRSTQQPECNIPLIVTTRACRQHRDPLDYRPPYDSMRPFGWLADDSLFIDHIVKLLKSNGS
jgi:hypothetical protein